VKTRNGGKNKAVVKASIGGGGPSLRTRAHKERILDEEEESKEANCNNNKKNNNRLPTMNSESNPKFPQSGASKEHNRKKGIEELL